MLSKEELWVAPLTAHFARKREKAKVSVQSPGQRPVIRNLEWARSGGGGEQDWGLGGG